jgi:polygalacturonase
MRIRHGLNLAVATLVSLVGVQSVSFAGAASHEATLHGHVRTFGPHHHQIQQPDPPKQSIPTVNVRDFGAVGDGVTDDTAAIQNAINAAQNNNEGVLFPAGTYLHHSILYASGVSLIGVGGASVLLADNPTASAVILTGISPSIQNMVVDSAPATSNTITFADPSESTLTVQNSQNFVVQGITIVNGSARPGVLLLQSSVGQVNGVTFTATGPFPFFNYGVIMESCANVSIFGNLFLNQGNAIAIGVFTGFLNNSVAVMSNTISTNVGSASGIQTQNVVTLDVSQNQIQQPSNGFPIDVNAGTSNVVTQNVISGGATGLFLHSAGSSNVVSQNIMRNCGGAGAVISTGAGTGNVAFLSNQFGECGTTTAGPVINLIPNGFNDITVMNNVYQGHANLLTDFLSSSAHLNFVSGNTQTQTALANNIP